MRLVDVSINTRHTIHTRVIAHGRTYRCIVCFLCTSRVLAVTIARARSTEQIQGELLRKSHRAERNLVGFRRATYVVARFSATSSDDEIITIMKITRSCTIIIIIMYRIRLRSQSGAFSSCRFVRRRADVYYNKIVVKLIIFLSPNAITWTCSRGRRVLRVSDKRGRVRGHLPANTKSNQSETFFEQSNRITSNVVNVR